jgi:hypothetical protein
VHVESQSVDGARLAARDRAGCAGLPFLETGLTARGQSAIRVEPDSQGAAHRTERDGFWRASGSNAATWGRDAGRKRPLEKSHGGTMTIGEDHLRQATQQLARSIVSNRRRDREPEPTPGRDSEPRPFAKALWRRIEVAILRRIDTGRRR